LHFEVVRADSPGPVVVEVPHAGLVVDEVSARITPLPAVAVRANAARADADLGADIIWESTEALGVTRGVARTQRYVIDLNTNPRPPPLPPYYEERLSPRVIPIRSQAGVSWRQPPIPHEEADRRIAEIFEPYHRAIGDALAASIARNGRAVLIASHTFPDPANQHPDVVIGTLEGKTASEALREGVATSFRDAGFSVSVETPFPGGYSIERHSRPTDGVSAIQIEIARRMVVDEKGDVSATGIGRVREVLVGVVEMLGR
jgi:N-formylglutamate amidohydrolase